MNTDLKKMGR